LPFSKGTKLRKKRKKKKRRIVGAVDGYLVRVIKALEVSEPMAIFYFRDGKS